VVLLLAEAAAELQLVAGAAGIEEVARVEPLLVDRGVLLEVVVGALVDAVGVDVGEGREATLGS
jgi:hypothetical protein